MPADNRKKPTGELPERYAPLIEYVSANLLDRMIAFESAFRLIESRRLIAEQQLRKTLQNYWSEADEQLKNRSPLDLVHRFEAYAEAIFKAAGETCLGQFRDPESYRSFLHVVRDWVLDAILPKPETFKQIKARQLALTVMMIPMVERAEVAGLWDHPSSRDLAAIRDDLKLIIQTPDEPIRDAVIEAMRQERIIGLRESFSAFEERLSGDIEDMYSLSGDWEQVFDDSLVDVLRKESDSISGALAGRASKIALRKAKNREGAHNVWTVALEQLEVTLLGAWWNASAESGVKVDQTALTKVLAQTRSSWLDAKLDGNYSDVDLGMTKSISYNTLRSYRSGGSILPKTRRGLCDALNALGISCEFSDIPE